MGLEIETLVPLDKREQPELWTKILTGTDLEAHIRAAEELNIVYDLAQTSATDTARMYIEYGQLNTEKWLRFSSLWDKYQREAAKSSNQINGQPRFRITDHLFKLIQLFR